MEIFFNFLYSEFESERDISITLFELIDDISLFVNSNNPISVHIDRKKERAIIDKFNELHNSILNISVERKKMCFVLNSENQKSLFEPDFLQKIMYSLLLFDLTLSNSSNIALASTRSVFDIFGFSQIVCTFSKKILRSTSNKY